MTESEYFQSQKFKDAIAKYGQESLNMGLTVTYIEDGHIMEAWMENGQLIKRIKEDL